jgi:hypothetical protein
MWRDRHHLMRVRHILDEDVRPSARQARWNWKGARGQPNIRVRTKESMVMGASEGKGMEGLFGRS